MDKNKIIDTIVWVMQVFYEEKLEPAATELVYFRRKLFEEEIKNKVYLSVMETTLLTELVLYTTVDYLLETLLSKEFDGVMEIYSEQGLSVQEIDDLLYECAGKGYDSDILFQEMKKAYGIRNEITEKFQGLIYAILDTAICKKNVQFFSRIDMITEAAIRMRSNGIVMSMYLIDNPITRDFVAGTALRSLYKNSDTDLSDNESVLNGIEELSSAFQDSRSGIVLLAAEMESNMISSKKNLGGRYYIDTFINKSSTQENYPE